eukprot:9395586-Karenia_brevis.AAC.1
MANSRLSIDFDSSEALIKNAGSLIQFLNNPHREGSQAYTHFENVKTATTVGEAKKKSASVWDLRGWIKKGSVIVTSSEAGGAADAVSMKEGGEMGLSGEEKGKSGKETDELNGFGLVGDVGDDRLKDRSRTFKSKSQPDMRAETIQKSKEARQAQLDSIRKLEKVRA